MCNSNLFEYMLAMVCKVKVQKLWYISTYTCTFHACKTSSTSTCIGAHKCFAKMQLGGDLLHQKVFIYIWFSFVYSSIKMQGRYLKEFTQFQLLKGSTSCLGSVVMDEFPKKN